MAHKMEHDPAFLWLVYQPKEESSCFVEESRYSLPRDFKRVRVFASALELYTSGSSKFAACPSKFNYSTFPVHARRATMNVSIQLISSHPVLIHDLRKISFYSEGFSFQILPPSAYQVRESNHIPGLCFFLLDGCSLNLDLGTVVTRCRSSCPGSKCLALLPPAVSNLAEKSRLFCWGMDGFVDLHETWQTELPRAVDNILQGRLWVSREVLEAFSGHEKRLLERQLSTGSTLTARERQVLQFLIRGLSNKEISHLIGTSERTIKFHVSNILGKLHLEDRRMLLPDSLQPIALRARV